MHKYGLQCIYCGVKLVVHRACKLCSCRTLLCRRQGHDSCGPIGDTEEGAAVSACSFPKTATEQLGKMMVRSFKQVLVRSVNENSTLRRILLCTSSPAKESHSRKMGLTTSSLQCFRRSFRSIQLCCVSMSSGTLSASSANTRGIGLGRPVRRKIAISNISDP